MYAENSHQMMASGLVLSDGNGLYVFYMTYPGKTSNFGPAPARTDQGINTVSRTTVSVMAHSQRILCASCHCVQQRQMQGTAGPLQGRQAWQRSAKLSGLQINAAAVTGIFRKPDTSYYALVILSTSEL